MHDHSVIKPGYQTPRISFQLNAFHFPFIMRYSVYIINILDVYESDIFV